MAPNGSLINSRDFPQLGKAKSIVLKVGTSILVDPSTNVLKSDWLESFVEEIAQLKMFKQLLKIKKAIYALSL